MLLFHVGKFWQQSRGVVARVPVGTHAAIHESPPLLPTFRGRHALFAIDITQPNRPLVPVTVPITRSQDNSEVAW